MTGSSCTASTPGEAASKLRSTCDRCTLLKVRCDKQKPRCERCKGVGVPCAYSPRRWKGRAAAKSVSSARSTTPPSVGSDTGTGAAASVVATPAGPWEPAVVGIALEFQDAPLGMGLQWEGLLPEADGLDLGGWYSGFMDVDQEMKDDVSSSHPSTRDPLASSPGVTPSPAPTPVTLFSHPGSALDPMASVSSQDAGRSVSGGAESPESSPGPAAASRCQCATLVFRLLQDMYHADPLSPYRLAPPGSDDGSSSSSSDGLLAMPGAGTTAVWGAPAAAPPRPRSDDMVKVNREAVRHMEQLLSCDGVACARDPTLFFLVAGLSSKLLAWYRAVFALVQRQQCPSDPPGPAAGGGGGADDDDNDEGAAAAATAELALVVPIQVEGFHLDFGSEQRMKAQFLLGEVRRLGQVLDLFGARAVARMPAPSYLAAAPGTLPIPAVHQYLTTSHSRLVAAVKEYCVS